MNKKLISRTLLVLLAIFIAFPIQPASAAVESFIDKFASNGIKFYNPDECSGDSGGVVGGEAVISGSTAEEKVWSGLKSMGISDEQAAGIMGNMAHEGNYFNPAQHEGSFYSQWETFPLNTKTDISYGIGLIQWSFGRRANVYNYIKERSPGLIKYLDKPKTYSYANGSTYGVNGDKFLTLVDSEFEADALYSLELTFLVNEELKVTNSYKGIFDQTTVQGAADFFLEHVEIPGDIEGTRPGRRQTAQEMYQKYSGKTSFGSGSTSVIAVDGNKVTMIGDSITVATEDKIKEKLPGIDIHAQVSKQFSGTDSSNPTGIQILTELANENKVREVLVFELGTNDSSRVTQTNIDKVLELAPNAKRVVFFTIYDKSKISSDGTDAFDTANQTFKTAAANSGGRIAVGDWSAIVKPDPDKYLSDGVHPYTSDGQEAFSDLVVRTISGAAQRVSSSSCDCTSGPSNGTYAGAKFELSDDEIKGILAMIKAENGGTINAVKFQASIMANLFEFYGPGLGESNDKAGFLHYIQRQPGVESGWFATYNLYDEGFTGYNQQEFDAVRDVLKNGNRTLPPQVLEHDAVSDIRYIKVDGNTYSDHDNIYKYENYISGKTIIKALGSEYIFYSFANPDGRTVSDSSGGNLTGDPFGYFPDNPPSQTSGGFTNAVQSSISWTDGWITGGMDGYHKDDAYTWTDVDHIDSSGNKEYGTTSAKGSGNGPNKILLHNTEGWLHTGDSMSFVYAHAGEAATPPHFTINIREKQVYQHFSILKTSTAIGSYDSTAGVQIEIMGFGGTIGNDQLRNSTDYLPSDANFGDADWDYLAKLLVGISKETGIPLTSTLGWSHNEPRLSADEFKSYTGILGHKHAPSPNTHTDPEDVWDKIKAAIDRAGGGTAECHNNSTGLKVGGMTLAEAEEFMKEYRNVVNAHQGKEYMTVTTVSGGTDTWGPIHCSDNNDGISNVAKNCVSFSWWFLRKYVDHDVSMGNGYQVVGNLGSIGYPTGTEPRPYAVFSWPGGDYGHTGIVLGVIDSETFIVGESSCSAHYTSSWAAQAKQYKITDYQWTFAYTDQWLKL